MTANGIPFQTPKVPLAEIGGPLPSCTVPEDADHASIAGHAVKQLNTLDASVLTDDAMWRDSIALTGTHRTFSGSRTVELAWGELFPANRPLGFELVTGSSTVIRMGPSLAWIEAHFAFSLQPENKRQKDCSGIVKVIQVGDEWKIWIVTTLLEEIEGYGPSDKMEPLSPEQSEKERAAVSMSSGREEFDVVVIGGGQCGLAVASRLKNLAISHVVLDGKAEVGDSWYSRYKSFVLHTSKYHSDMPYGGVFGPEHPYFLTSKHLSDGLKLFVERWGLNVWMKSLVKKASWDKTKEEWTVEFEYLGKQSNGTHQNGDKQSNSTCPVHQLRARHVVFAMGSGGQMPNYPDIPNRHLFQGETLHSVNYATAHAWTGKRGVIIGTANTAHDVSVDMVEAGLESVTLIQRNPTPIFPVSFYHHFYDPLYNEHSNVALVDRTQEEQPLPITHKLVLAGVKPLAAQLSDYYDAFEANGFRVVREIDLIHVLFERFGSHYYDVGASAKIFDGSVAVKQGPVESFTPTGLRLADGTTLDADVVVYATGFVGNMRMLVAGLVGDEMSARLDDFWGVDGEGELRGNGKPMVGQKNAWYMGGDFRMARHHSRLLALQIKADLEGETLDVYRKTPGE